MNICGQLTLQELTNFRGVLTVEIANGQKENLVFLPYLEGLPSCSGRPNRTENTEISVFRYYRFGSDRFGKVRKYRTETSRGLRANLSPLYFFNF